MHSALRMNRWSSSLRPGGRKNVFWTGGQKWFLSRWMLWMRGEWWISKFPKTFQFCPKKKSSWKSHWDEKRLITKSSTAIAQALRLEFPKPPEEVPRGSKLLFFRESWSRCITVLLFYIFLRVYNLYNCKVPSKNRLLLPGFFGSDFPTNPPFAHQQDKLRYLTRFLEKIQESTHAAAVRTPGVASGVKNGFPGLDNVCTSKVLTKPQRKRIWELMRLVLKKKV